MRLTGARRADGVVLRLAPTIPQSTFVRAEPEHDLHFTDYLGLDDVDGLPADYPITVTATKQLPKRGNRTNKPAKPGQPANK